MRILGLATRKRGERRGRSPASLRFRSLASLSFPPSELCRYQPAREPEQADATDEMMVSFIGLTGPSGALPTSYTELLLERRQQYKDDSLHAFLDIFSHRATALFFGAWRKYRYWLEVEAGERDGFTRNLLDLGGLGLSQLRKQMGPDAQLDENLFIYYAGLLSQKPLSAQALETLIQGFFGVDAALEQFVGQWMKVPATEQSRLGASDSELGVSLFAGARVWDRQTKLQLRLGSMRRAQFEALLRAAPARRPCRRCCNSPSATIWRPTSAWCWTSATCRRRSWAARWICGWVAIAGWARSGGTLKTCATRCCIERRWRN